MSGYSYYKDQEQWNKIDKKHYKEQMGKIYIVNHCHWEPGKNYNGKIGKVIDAHIFLEDSNVRFVELDTAPGVIFTINDLKEVT